LQFFSGVGRSQKLSHKVVCLSLERWITTVGSACHGPTAKSWISPVNLYFYAYFYAFILSMGANGWPAVATRSQQDFQDQTPMIVRSLVENRVEVPGVGSRDQATRNQNRAA
jgi:hypothetical protein